MKDMLWPKFLGDPILEQTITVYYKEKDRMRHFKKLYGQDFESFEDILLNFDSDKSRTDLEHKKTYEAKVFPIREAFPIQQMCDMGIDAGQIYPGAQGLALFWESHKEKLPLGIRVFPFFERKSLIEDPVNNLRVPFIERDSQGKFEFKLEWLIFNFSIKRDHVLLFFE